MADTLTVNVSGVEISKGNIRIGIFNSKDEFPEGNRFQEVFISSKENTVQNTFKLKPGKYAVAVFQDENNNQKMDKNFFGIPKEKYGFSGRKVFGKPNFYNAMIDVENYKTITIAIK